MISCAQHCTRNFLGYREQKRKKQPYNTRSNKKFYKSLIPIKAQRCGAYLGHLGSQSREFSIGRVASLWRGELNLASKDGQVDGWGGAKWHCRQ